MPSRALAASLVVALAVALAACGSAPAAPDVAVLVGTGDVVTELRDLPPFTRVSVAAGLKLTAGESNAQEVTVSAQANLLPAIETVVVDGQLIVTPTGTMSSSEPIAITLKMTAVESVALSAGAIGYVESTGDALSLDVSGGAQVTGIGEAGELRLTASTGSHAKLAELVAEHAQVALSDGASAELTVRSSVAGSADGGATLVLTAPPAQVDVETSSGGTVQGG
jgi:hypothetical protein